MCTEGEMEKVKFLLSLKFCLDWFHYVVYMNVLPVCVSYTTHVPGSCMYEKRSLDPLGLEMQTVVSCHVSLRQEEQGLLATESTL